MQFRKKKKDLEMEMNSRKDSYPTSRSNCRKCGRESSPHWRILQRQHFVDDKQRVPEDTLGKSQKHRTRKSETECPGTGMQEMKSHLEPRA